MTIKLIVYNGFEIEKNKKTNIQVFQFSKRYEYKIIEIFVIYTIFYLN